MSVVYIVRAFGYTECDCWGAAIEWRFAMGPSDCVWFVPGTVED